MARFQARVALRMMVVPRGGRQKEQWDRCGGMHAVGAAGWFFFGDGSCQTRNSREYDADCTVKYLDCVGIYTKMYVTKLPRPAYSHPNGSMSYWRDLQSSGWRPHLCARFGIVL